MMTVLLLTLIIIQFVTCDDDDDDDEQLWTAQLFSFLNFQVVDTGKKSRDQRDEVSLFFNRPDS